MSELAISRRFIILDTETSPEQILALASVVVALGATYWLIRDSDARRHGAANAAP